MTPLPAPHAVEAAGSTALVYDHGAHLVSWVPSGHRPVLFLSSSAVLDSGAAIRGGVPICLPWFGGGRSGDRTPAHGFARLSPWTVLSQETNGEQQVLTFRLDHRADDGNDASPFVADYRISVGKVLDLQLAVHNTGTTDLIFEEALHAYLEVGDVQQVRVHGLDGSWYLDKTDDGRPVQQHGEVAVQEETDRVYQSTAAVVVEDPVLGRRVRVTRTNSSSLVMWNPGQERAARIADLGAGEWRSFLCVEGANVLDSAITLTPGASHFMGYLLEVH